MSSNISFAQNLQSERGHRAIMFRLESELKILEVFRKFLNLQVKLDKEHSSVIGNATSSAIKAINSVLVGGSESSNHQSGNSSGRKLPSANASVISSETVHVLQEIESKVTNVKRNLNFLEESTLTELNELITQKKILVKAAQEEYTKIKGNLDQFSENIKKLRVEYFKQFNSYETSRTKFEDNCAKAGSPSGGETLRKSEDLRDKFFRMKGRLNLSHTEYLIMIHEGKLFDRDFRTILLPSLLQIEQSWCERQLKQWGSILDGVLHHSSAITPEARFKLKEFEFGIEFAQLIEKYKTQPLLPMDFKFEPARISSQPVAQSGLILDSSTVPFLRKKIAEIEKRFSSAEIGLKQKQSDKVKYKGHDLVEDLKSFDILVSKCDIDRIKSLNQFLTSHLKGASSNSKLDAISLASEDSLRKPNKRSRFTTFLRQATLLTKKSTSYECDTLPPKSSSLIGSAPSMNLNQKRDLIKSVADEQWFHGVLPREEVIRLLINEGDYLVRETSKNGEPQLVLSALWKGYKHFIIQVTPSGQFQFEGRIFPNVKELLGHHIKSKEPITFRSATIIENPVHREKWELNNDDVQLIEKIGKGNFGDVYKAIVNGSVVAVKTCKVDLAEDQKRKFLREARILKQYNHPNIVHFIGICAQKQPIMIAMELVPGGSLLTYLKGKGKSIEVKLLTKITLDTASGMKYLEENNCLHRDLAARNCLIDESGPSVKISDFGMSREEHEYTVSDGLKQIPIKWTAPEALNYGKYTTLSDCWSFGVLMWEIFAQGSTPYPGMTNGKAREMIEAGYRMTAPEGVPDVIYQLMTRCWQYEPEQRPRFAEIHSEIEIIWKSDLI